ncbi:MAG: hypothetical protein ACE5GX_04480 [Thermoanaerobaculia bacterium]
MSTYSITEDVKRALEASFVEERDLIDGVREHKAVEEPDRPGIFGSSFVMTVRRALDLETAELRRVDVKMRSSAGGFEIFQVDGLPESG